MFPQLARVTDEQLDVTVQHIQNAFAYTVDEFLIAVRNDYFTLFMFGCLHHVEGVII